MVRFDAYAEKIRKVAVFKNIVVKFRVLIISVLALITASTTAYLISKGSVINNVTLSPTFTYGEEITVEEGKALFSDYYYEYSLAGSGIWSEEKPIAPGKY